MPLLFYVVTATTFIGYFLQKILTTYWHDFVFISDDLIVRISLRVLRYAPCLFLIVGGFILRTFGGAVSNERFPQSSFYINEP